MSFTTTDKSSRVYAPGYFLAKEECERKTFEVDSTDERVITASNGGKFLPMGVAYPSNDSNAIGIVYEDVDVSTGNMPCSVVLKGSVYEGRLSEELTNAAKTALVSAGIKFLDEPTVTRG
jgi:hypothetical protein